MRPQHFTFPFTIPCLFVSLLEPCLSFTITVDRRCWLYKSFHKDQLYCQFTHRHHNFKFWIVLCENCKQICIHCKALHCYKRINSHEYAKQPSTTMIRTKASSIWFYIMHDCILPSPQQNFQTVIKVGKILKYMSHNFCLVCSDFTCF